MAASTADQNKKYHNMPQTSSSRSIFVFQSEGAKKVLRKMLKSPQLILVHQAVVTLDEKWKCFMFDAFQEEPSLGCCKAAASVSNAP
eukprot:scaffold39576_cov32-Attheya_sp.AAC.1